MTLATFPFNIQGLAEISF